MTNKRPSKKPSPTVPTWQQRLRTWMTMVNIRRALVVVSVVAYLVAMLALVRVGLVPVKYLWILLPLSMIGMGVLVRAQWHRVMSLAKSITSMVVSLVIIMISVGVISTAVTLQGFFGGVQHAEYSTETYSIIAKKDRAMTLDAAATAALLETDQYLGQVKEGLATKTAADPVMRSNLTEIVVALDDHATDTAVLSAAYMRLLAEGNTATYRSIEVLATFTIRVSGTATSGLDVTKPFALYISGIDTHGEISAVSRSDVNMLMVVNPRTHRVLLVNTPRDYYVQLHGTTGAKDKLTHAGLYGVDMSRQTLEDLYDIPIDAYVRVNFDSLVGIVDAVGGIEVQSDYAFKQFRVGTNYLNGAEALTFSRERYSFSEGDRQRGRNQQRVIEAIIAKMGNPRNILNYQAILRAVEGAVQTNISQKSLTQLVNHQLDTLRSWRVESMSVDGRGAMDVTYSMGAQPLYVMVPDQETVEFAQRKINDVLTY